MLDTVTIFFYFLPGLCGVTTHFMFPAGTFLQVVSGDVLSVRLINSDMMLCAVTDVTHTQAEIKNIFKQNVLARNILADTRGVLSIQFKCLPFFLNCVGVYFG